MQDRVFSAQGFQAEYFEKMDVLERLHVVRKAWESVRFEALGESADAN